MTKYLQILLVFVATLGSFPTIAQQDSTRSWQEIIAQPVINYAEAKKAFETQWKDNLERKGYKQFRRWEQFVRPLLDENGIYDAQKILEIKREVIKQREERKQLSRTTQRANWKLLGPAAPPAPANFNNESVGRIDCIGFHPTDANTFYVGSPTGGFWKTTDGGKNWAFLSQSWVELGVSDIAIDPINPNIVYVATGDRDSGRSPCFGILKSTDGGMTWNAANTGLPSIRYMYRLLIHPTQPNVLFVSTYRNGIWKTTNGGGQWVRCAGITNTEFTEIYDMEFKPNDPNTIYAVSASKLFKSNNLGDTFSQVMGLSFDATKSSRMALAVTPAAPEKVFLANAAVVNNAYVVEGVYRSDDGGNGFTKIASSNTKLTGTAYTFGDYSSQAWFTWSLGVSPTNANEILLGDVGLFKTSDGGTTWEEIISVSNIHVDIHAIEYQPKTNRLYVGSDGGIKRAPTGNTKVFENLNYGISNLEAYHVGGLANNNDVAYIGCQDNWVMKYDKGNWRIMRLIGDGGESVIDPTNLNVAYACRQLGQISKTTDGGANWTTINPTPRPSSFWMIPLVMNPANSQELLAGYDQVYKTTNGGASWQIAGSLPANSYVSEIYYAPSNAQIIYLSVYQSGSYRIYKSTDGGANWTQLPNGWGFDAMLVHPTNPQKLWGKIISGNIMTSNDGGQTWIDYQTTNLIVNKMAYQLGTNDGIYFATNLGVYYRDATMSAWQSFDDDLPNISVTDLEISYQGAGIIRASTYGRGLWESNLYQNANCAKSALPTLPTASVNYCVGATASPLAATGSELKWYTTETGGQAVGSITPSTSAAAQLTYFVSQTETGKCEGGRAKIEVIVRANSAPPTVSTPSVNYCIGAVATPLIATGSSLKWYAVETGGRAENSIVPPTNTVATLAYYVSQTETDKCESNRAKLEVVIKPKPTGILSGSKTIFQYDSTQIQVALTGDAPWSIVLDNQTKLQAQNNPTSLFVKPLQTTTYRLTSVENACGLGTVSGEAVISVTPVLSVSPNQNDEMQVFPNPTAGDLTIKAKVVSNAAYDIELIDATGRVLIKQTNTWLNSGNEVKLATSQLATGTYLLRVVGKQKNYVWKVAKQ